MFTSFDEKAFKQAIVDKDFLRLKINAVSAISYDPAFEKGEAEAVLKILKNEVPDIFEKYVEGDYEERLEKSEWDKRYFSKLLYWFQENFAEERIVLIKEVGKKVHANNVNAVGNGNTVSNISVATQKAQQSSRGMNVGVTQNGNRGSHTNFTKAPEKKNSLIGIIAVAGVVVLVIVLLLKLLTK